MGSREAVEEAKATSSMEFYRPPTMKPGLGAPRCPRCSAPLSKDLEASGWTIAPFLRDSFAMIGTAVGGSVSAFYGFNRVMPPIRRWISGPMWLQFVVGLPPLMLFSISCAGLAGGALPAFAQLGVSSYHAASAASHSTISQVTMHIEGREELQSFTNTTAGGQSQPSIKDKG